MNLVDLRCPNCNGVLKDFDYFNSFFCSHCGARLEIDGQRDIVVLAKLRSKEMEHEERMFDKHVAYEERKQEKEEKERSKALKQAVFWILGMMIVPMVFINIVMAPEKRQHKKVVKNLETLSEEIETDITNENYDAALLKANRLRMDDDWSSEETMTWDHKRESYIEIINEKKADIIKSSGEYLYAPKNANEFSGLTLDEARQILIEAGFDQIKEYEVSNSDVWTKKANSVDHVAIGGQIDFTTESYFRKGTRVLIYYYDKNLVESIKDLF